MAKVIYSKIKNEVEFERLNNGTVFLFDDCIFMKVSGSEKGTVVVGGLGLSSGLIFDFGPKQLVYRLSKDEIVKLHNEY